MTTTIVEKNLTIWTIAIVNLKSMIAAFAVIVVELLYVI